MQPSCYKVAGYDILLSFLDTYGLSQFSVVSRDDEILELYSVIWTHRSSLCEILFFCKFWVFCVWCKGVEWLLIMLVTIFVLCVTINYRAVWERIPPPMSSARDPLKQQQQQSLFAVKTMNVHINM